MAISKGYLIVPSLVFYPVLMRRQSNVLIDDTGRARVTDFGLATVTRSPDSARNADEDHGVQWIAPEILNGQGTYGKEADVFSFAMVTIEVRCNDPSDQSHHLLAIKRHSRTQHHSVTNNPIQLYRESSTEHAHRGRHTDRLRIGCGR